MRKFEVLRYFKKWWLLIVAVCFLAGVFFVTYTSNHQVYTAQSVIRYNYPLAEEGLTPNEQELDVSEIFSANVVKGVLEELNLSGSVDSIRSAGSVEEVIPEDVQRSQEAKIDNGDEYEEYHPVEYYVYFSADSDHGAEYAREVLDEVLSNYLIAFSEKYVNRSVIPNNAENVLSGSYDYIEQAEIINNSVSEIISQLGDRQSASPDFWSSSTGLTLSDLLDQYTYIRDVKIPYLFSEILNEKLTEDKEILIKKYKERKANYNLTSETDTAKIAAVLEVIESYGEKNKEGSLYYNSDSTDNEGELNGNILGDVYEDRDVQDGEDEPVIVDRTTVYDGLIADYVTLENSKSYKIIDAAYCQYIIDVFQTAENSQADTAEAGAAIEEEITALLEELNALYGTLELTMQEYNEYLGAQNVTVLSSTAVTESINAKLYVLLGVMLFFVVGCLGAIFLGRLQDFVEFAFYTDSKLKMPNRNACDWFIKSHSEKILENSYACMVLELSNLYRVNNTLGRNAGDALLKEFAELVKQTVAARGKVYYNGGQQFIGFFEKCSREDLENQADFMQRLVKNYNEEHPDNPMEYTIGKSESKSDNAYSVRKLLQNALKNRAEQEV